MRNSRLSDNHRQKKKALSAYERNYIRGSLNLGWHHCLSFASLVKDDLAQRMLRIWYLWLKYKHLLIESCETVVVTFEEFYLFGLNTGWRYLPSIKKYKISEWHWKCMLIKQMLHGNKYFFENVPLIFCPGGKIFITKKTQANSSKKWHLFLYLFSQLNTGALSCPPIEQ